MSYRYTLVTDFATLKSGDYVEVRGCCECGAPVSRGILTSREPDGRWWTTPSCCTSVIGRPTVRQRRVFLIDTGLEDSQTTSTTKPRQLAKTGDPR